MTRTTEPTARVADMFAQSTAVLARPASQTFERFERRGGVASALLYVLVAAVVSGMVGALFSVFHSDVTFWGQLVSRLIAIPLQFLVFTGAVYLIGRGLFRGTGTYPEVAYTFALFFVPLSILGSLLGLIPLLGWLVVGPIISLLLAFFGFLAVQSSMNLRDPVPAGVTLVLSALAYLLVGAWLLG
ncbi:MAG: YIP1 family protein [Deinococcus sp.]|uniref:YIP1 family protein n=1 Tax=Deinococcus sp. TaxID=47478 RepID=UPI0026DB070F|nr:YIP1 family protein [Deinococcus sp.]MDO4244638.1 YIP1 family protein [Deinococcus sp.]